MDLDTSGCLLLSLAMQARASVPARDALCLERSAQNKAFEQNNQLRKARNFRITTYLSACSTMVAPHSPRELYPARRANLAPAPASYRHNGPLRLPPTPGAIGGEGAVVQAPGARGS